MKKITKIWMIVAVAFLLIGGLLFTGVMTMMNWNFKKLSTDRFSTNEYTISEPFQKIAVHTMTADVTFVPTDGESRVVCYEEEKFKHRIAVEGDTLLIDLQDERKWYHHLGLHFEKAKITIFIPKGEYEALKVENTTGDLEIPKGFQFGEAELSVTTGDISLKSSVRGGLRCKSTTGDIELCGLRCGSIEAFATTGDYEMEDVVAEKKIKVDLTTGDVEFKDCDAAELSIKVTTGHVEGTLLSEKVFEVKATTGHVEVPLSGSGGLCKVKTTTGHIKIRIK